MTHDPLQSASGPQRPSEDELQADALDDYLQRLQAGEHVDRAALVERFPELVGMLDYMERLEGLAAFANGEDAPPDDPRTVRTHRSAGPAGDSQADLTHVTAPSASSGSAPNLALGEQPPKDIGGYEIISEVGRGGMGIVFRARQKTLDRIVALKMIATGLASAAQVRRFYLEAQAAAKLRHPNIVAIHEIGESYGQHFLVMEFIQGHSLAERLRTAPPSIEESVILLSAIARAVDHLHRHGVIHRDLKPSNVLLDESGKPYVADFGLAKFFESGDRTDTGVIAGTPSYMSPEQAYGKSAAVGPASDVYSLGAILYEMLTGRPPFRGENNLITILMVRDREAELPTRLNPKIPGDLELICLRCLEKSPEDRYASAGELADDLDAYLRGEDVAAQPWGQARRIWRWARREPALATRFAGVGLFYLVELFNFARGAVPGTFHMWVTVVLFAWVVASILLQRLLRREANDRPLWVQAAWCATDVISLTLVLPAAGAVASPAVVAYPLLIVSAGLWSRVRLVWLMTGLTSLAYALLVILYYMPWYSHPRFDDDFDRHVYFLLALWVCGCLTAYHVWRVRVLTQYYDRSRKGSE